MPHLSSGELLRAHVSAGTELGSAPRDVMSRGDLIADDLVITMVADEVLGPDATGGFVLDGFPRTVAQATAAYDMARRHGITLQAVILLEIPHQQLLDRLISRGLASGRVDDTAETIEHRIDIYTEQTMPLVDYYTGRDILLRIDATGSSMTSRPRSTPRSTAFSLARADIHVAGVHRAAECTVPPATSHAEGSAVRSMWSRHGVPRSMGSRYSISPTPARASAAIASSTIGQ